MSSFGYDDGQDDDAENYCEQLFKMPFHRVYSLVAEYFLSKIPYASIQSILFSESLLTMSTRMMVVWWALNIVIFRIVHACLLERASERTLAQVLLCNATL